MINKKVCYKIDKYDCNHDGIILDKVLIEGSNFYIVQNDNQTCIDTVRCDKILYIRTSRY